MEPRSSVTSGELRAVGVEGSEATLVSQEKGDPPGLVLFPAAAVAKDTPDEDAFMVELNQNDPSHPMVCVARHFPTVGLSIGILGNTHSEPFERDEMVFVRVGWNPGF